MSDVKPVPDGFNTVSAYLVVPNSIEALGFYAKALGAEEIARMTLPDGKTTMHAEMRIGNSIVMMSDENPQCDTKSPSSLGGTPVSMALYVADCDTLFNRAVEAGCTVQMPLTDMFWGDRYGQVVDPYGHIWSILTHQEDVGEEEMASRQAEFIAQMAQGKTCGE